MSHVTERPQADGTTEYDVIWRDAVTGRRKKYEAESKADTLRFKRVIDAQGDSPADSRRTGTLSFGEAPRG